MSEQIGHTAILNALEESIDWKSCLNLYVQQYPLAAPRYMTNQMSGTQSHCPMFASNCYCHKSSGYGEGPNKAMAEQLAARRCLFDLNVKRAMFNASKSGKDLISPNVEQFERTLAIEHIRGARPLDLVNLIKAHFDSLAPSESEGSAHKGFVAVTSWSGKEVEQPNYGSEPRVQSNAGRAIRRINDIEKPNWTQAQLLLEEAFALDQANAKRQLRHMMERSFNLKSFDGLLEWD